MKKNIQAIKVGNVINFSINGKLYKKVCKDTTEANEMFGIILKAKENPSDENIKNVKIYMNEKTRVLMIADLKDIEIDIESGESYLAGFNTPIPKKLIEVIKEYHENKFPMQPIINFWKLLMINPDVRVRTSLFDFISTHDFVLTDNGYMVVYKAVYKVTSTQMDNNGKYLVNGEAESNKPAVDNVLTEFVSNKYLTVKSKWKCSPKKYVVYKNKNNELALTELKTAEKNNIEVLGKLDDLYNALVTTVNEKPVTEAEPVQLFYTDMYTRTMKIELGVPAQKKRNECNSDPAVDCSQGLHVGATKYVEKFANWYKDGKKVILACFVNPANVVAVPNYDHSKMRVDEYFPFAIATYENGKIDIVDQMYFEDDYSTIELEVLNAQIEKVKANEKPIETAKKAKEEVRPMSELLKILESRVFDLNN